MEIGELRHRITLQKPVKTVSSSGVEEKQWQDITTVWGKVEHLRGRDFYEAAAVQAEQTVKVTIRYREGITPQHRLIHRGAPYTITFIDRETYPRRFLIIHAQEVVPGG